MKFPESVKTLCKDPMLKGACQKTNTFSIRKTQEGNPYLYYLNGEKLIFFPHQESEAILKLLKFWVFAKKF